MPRSVCLFTISKMATWLMRCFSEIGEIRAMGGDRSTDQQGFGGVGEWFAGLLEGCKGAYGGEVRSSEPTAILLRFYCFLA